MIFGFTHDEIFGACLGFVIMLYIIAMAVGCGLWKE